MVSWFGAMKICGVLTGSVSTGENPLRKAIEKNTITRIKLAIYDV